MTNFLNHLLSAVPFGLLSAVLILIRKPTAPDTGWYISFILVPSAVIVFSCLSLMVLEKRYYERKRKALHRKLKQGQDAETEIHRPPDNRDGPEAA